VAHAELVAVLQVDLGMAAFRALLGGFALIPSADLLAVDLRAVETAEVAQARGGRVHFDEEMVRETRVSSPGKRAWQSAARPKMKVSCSSKTKALPFIAPSANWK